MKCEPSSRAILISVLVPLVLTAQMAREHDPVPLKNWPAPLYWQPAPGDLETSARPPSPLAPLTATTNLPLGSNALVFVAMTPCRVVDTRQGQGFTGAFGPPSIGAGLPVRTIPIESNTTCSIPAFARAYSFNVTVVPAGSLLYITLYPATSGTQPSPPTASTLNAPLGNIVANAAIVPAGTDGHGSVDVYASSATDLIIDINGYYAAPGDLNGNTALGDGALASNTSGGNNTASGLNALAFNTTGSFNTANGYGALNTNTTGTFNTASGYFALVSNTTGGQNTANGSQALQNNTTGNLDTAIGYQALQNNTTGTQNTASGVSALQSNTTGNENTATGVYALLGNTTGGNNTATGFNALAFNTTGSLNAAGGALALVNNTTGSDNTASGGSALGNSTTGSYNTAYGAQALLSNTTGSGNIAIGYQAADSVSGSNSNNIHIGSEGAFSDSGVIRVGSPGQQSSFLAAGIRGVTTGNNDAIPVVIDSNGQLGTVSSSRRFKEDIQDMGDASSGLLRLRPVTFRYRQPFADGSKPIEYGLIAEEVAEVYPDLVAHSADGQIESVKYQVLDSMLLNELQKQAEKIRRQEQKDRQQAEQNRQQAEKIRSLEDRLAALEALLPKATAPAADRR